MLTLRGTQMATNRDQQKVNIEQSKNIESIIYNNYIQLYNSTNKYNHLTNNTRRSPVGKLLGSPLFGSF